LIVSEAQQRLRKEGWDSVRPALSTTIRSGRFACVRSFVFIASLSLLSGLLMRGFLEGGARANYVAQVEMYSRCIEILEWGQKAWANISCEKRGSVFEHTFVRGIRAMRLEALMEVCQLAFDPVNHLFISVLKGVSQ
jgi:hypothetical protein